MRPKTDGILESSLYVSDVPRSIRFYEETFGFSVRDPDRHLIELATPGTWSVY
jgi:predicted enzyme related to lactoylglutathione lyase